MRSFATLLVLAAFAAVAIAGSGPGDKIFPFDYQKVELENGFKAYLIKAGAPGQICYVTMVRTGSRDEWEPGKSGFAHFFEHMMFRGTDKYPNYDSITADMGAARNAFTSSDRTVYYLVASTEYLEQIVDLESDRFMNLKYSEPDFRTEAGAVLGEYQQGKFSPFRYLDENVRNTAFDAHTYKHTTIGFEADVRAMPEGYEYSTSFHQRYYRPENCVLVLAGDFDVAAAEKLIRQYYGPWKKGYVPPQITPEPPQTAPREKNVPYPGRTLPILSINYKAPAWSATDRLAVALEVLGDVAFGQNSEIYRTLVLKEQKLQMLQAGFGLSRDPGLVSINTMVMKAADVPAIKEAVEATIAKFQTELCDAKTLADTKSNLKYGYLMGLETAQNVAFSLMQVVINTGGIEAIEDYYTALEAVTPEDLREAAKKYLVPTGRTTVIMAQAEAQ